MVPVRGETNDSRLCYRDLTVATRGAWKRLLATTLPPNWEHNDTVAAGRCNLWNIAPGAADRLAPKDADHEGPATAPAFCVLWLAIIASEKSLTPA
jgi:hypothetical protein